MPSTAMPVMVIGSLNMDLVARCARLPMTGETVFGQDFFTAFGGKGANQAVAAARLGARVGMAGCLGNDAFGAQLREGLRDAGIDARCVASVPRATGTALITVDAAGANTIVVISGANMQCDAALVDRALSDCASPGILLLQHEIPDAANAHAIRAAHAAGWFIVLNPAPARPIAPELLPLIDIVAPNESEAAVLTNQLVNNPAGTSSPVEAALTNQLVSSVPAAREATHMLLARGARGVLITLGANGAVYCDARHEWHCPAIAVQAVDTTAAGDAYLGALATALAERRTLADSLGFAAAAAAIAVTRLGAQPSLATRAELEDFIARHGTPVVTALA